MSFTCWLVHFNHKRFVICINDPATYVSLGTDKKNHTLIQKVTDHKVYLILEHHIASKQQQQQQEEKGHGHGHAIKRYNTSAS